jgi:hypothetical protein
VEFIPPPTAHVCTEASSVSSLPLSPQVYSKVLSVLAHYAAYLSTYSSFMSFWKTHNIGRDYNTFNLTNQNAQHQHYFPWIDFWQRQKRGTH